MKYVIYRDDRSYPISADNLEELKKLRAEGNRMFINHGYGSIAEYYDKETKTTKYIDIYTKEETSWDGKYVYLEWPTAMWYMKHDNLYDGKLTASEKIVPNSGRKTNKPYPPYEVHTVNRAWRDSINYKLKKQKENEEKENK